MQQLLPATKGTILDGMNELRKSPKKKQNGSYVRRQCWACPQRKACMLSTALAGSPCQKKLQQQEWNRRTVLRPILFGTEVLSDSEMNYGAPKTEMFAVVMFIEKYRSYLGSAPFKLRLDRRALSLLKTY